MKKILVVGGGGREHALIWKLSLSPEVSKIYCAPGNAGIAHLAACVPLRAEDVDGLAAFAEKEAIDFTIVGPELPLTLGIVDTFRARGLAVCGPDARAAELEASKSFAKDFMKKYRIPTAGYQTFSAPAEAAQYVRSQGSPLVIKADGLAAGKGVILAKTEKEALDAIDLIMVRRAFKEAGDKVIVETLLEGEEASFIVFTDGRTVVPLPTSQDHKAVFDGDQGPNTGGMGAYSPAPVVTPELSEKVMRTIMVPTIQGMAREGRTYRGILYAGLMIKAGEPQVLEYNVRLGDPETQPLLVRMRSDLLPVLEATTQGTLGEVRVEWDERPAVCVVMASAGYPGDYETGREISGLDAGQREEVQVFHAGTALRDGKTVTSGGRVLGVTALGATIDTAISNAYDAVGRISWEGVHFRRDIGAKARRHVR
jgi:phosphoribosylamine---glycine ligase